MNTQQQTLELIKAYYDYFNAGDMEGFIGLLIDDVAHDIGSQARALENQCYVVHAPLVGTAPWSPTIDINTVAAGIYTG